MDLKLPKSEIQLYEDPYLQLGFGMNAYFDFIKQLLYMTLGMTIFVIPFMCIFAKYDALESTSMAMFNQFSLGNMGGSQTSCSQVP